MRERSRFLRHEYIDDTGGSEQRRRREDAVEGRLCRREAPSKQETPRDAAAVTRDAFAAPLVAPRSAGP